MCVVSTGGYVSRRYLLQNLQIAYIEYGLSQNEQKKTRHTKRVDFCECFWPMTIVLAFSRFLPLLKMYLKSNLIWVWIFFYYFTATAIIISISIVFDAAIFASAHSAILVIYFSTFFLPSSASSSLFCEVAAIIASSAPLIGGWFVTIVANSVPEKIWHGWFYKYKENC